MFRRFNIRNFTLQSRELHPKERKPFTRLANNYAPLPVNIIKGKDIYLWDDNGIKYVDLLAGYSAVNQGHCHLSIIKALYNQASQLTLTSRVVNCEPLYQWSEYITDKFNYDRVLAMNSGAEAVETAIKLSRKYGNEVLNISKPYIVCLTGNFHGRTYGSLSLSDYPSYKKNFGPFINNIIFVEMNHVPSLRRAFEKCGSNISAILYEPLQGEGGVIPMSPEFVSTLEKIKQEYPKVLFMADEIQCGLGRVGSLVASNKIFNNLKPDVLILGKALSGGILPMSCILANKNIMDVFTPGTHGSTFGGNPLACSVSIAALKVIEHECIPNVKIIGPLLEKLLMSLSSSNIIDIRGMGLFWGVQFNNNYDLDALRLRMLKHGYITCTSRLNTLRITPPLTINSTEIKKAICKLNELL
jgi:ornithine--oxo-acid transaminase